MPFQTTCSSGLFFDIDTKQCNYRENIVACGGKKEEIAPVTYVFQNRPSVQPSAFNFTECRSKAVSNNNSCKSSAAPVSPALDRPIVGIENFCLTKVLFNRGIEEENQIQEDGFYGDGCKPHFFSCQGGAMYKVCSCT